MPAADNISRIRIGDIINTHLHLHDEDSVGSVVHHDMVHVLGHHVDTADVDISSRCYSQRFECVRTLCVLQFLVKSSIQGLYRYQLIPILWSPWIQLGSNLGGGAFFQTDIL